MSEPSYGTPPPEPVTGRPGADLYAEEPMSPAPTGSAAQQQLEAQVRRLATKNLRKRAAFRVHLVTYLAVIGMLFTIWLVIAVAAGAWFPWFVFPALGWGVGLVIHAWDTFSGDPMSEAKIQAEMRRITGT